MPGSHHIHLAAPATPNLDVHMEPQQNPGVYEFYFWCSDISSEIASFALVVLGEQKEKPL